VTLLVKVGGRVQSEAALPDILARTFREAGRLVVVHGGADEISHWQRRLGAQPSFSGGRRVTTPEELEIVRMVLSGAVNKRLVRQLAARGVPAVGISGEDGGLLAGERLSGLGSAGTPSRVEVGLLETLLGAGFLPVVSPLARDAESGEGLNVNGDDAAAAIAAALGCEELVFVSDVAAVMDSDGSPLAMLDSAALQRLLDTRTAAGGMAAKLQAARQALLSGVQKVRIGDLGTLIDQQAGTAIVLAATTV
jgi:acetylglutamate kinase